MKETQTALNRGDVVVHLRDMALYVLLRWRRLLIIALAAAVLLAGGMYVRDYRQYRQALQAVTAPEGQGTLSPAQREAADAVRQLQMAVDAQCAYNQGALLMQIDAAAAPTGTLYFLVSGEQAYETVALYRKYLTRAEMYAKLEGCGDTLTACPAELLTTAIERDELYGDTTRLFMTVQVLAPTEALCRQMMDLIKTEAETLVPAIQAQTGTFTCSLAYERQAVLRQPALLESQRSNHAKLTALQTELDTAAGKLNSAQQAYLGLTDKAVTRTVSVPRLSAKWAVLGFAAGLLLPALWYALRYVLEKRVQSKQDLAIRYGLPIFGGLESPARKKASKVDRRLIALLRDAADPPSVAERQVALALAGSGCGRVYLALSDLTASEQACLGGLRRQLEEKGVALTEGTCPPQDGDTLEQMATADAVLPVVKIGVSRHPSVYRTLELAQQLDRPGAGILLLQ